MLGFLDHFLRRVCLVLLTAVTIGPVAAAGTITPSSMGAMTTTYREEDGMVLITETFTPLYPAGGFSVVALDGRSPTGPEVEAAASFRLTDLDPSEPLKLRVVVTEAWGYWGYANLEVSVYGSHGAVSMGDFSAGSSYLGVGSVPSGSGGNGPVLLDFDATAAVAWALGEGYEYLGVRFEASSGGRYAYVRAGRLFLGSDPLPIPEPASWTMAATGALGLGVVLSRLRRGARTSTRRCLD